VPCTCWATTELHCRTCATTHDAPPPCCKKGQHLFAGKRSLVVRKGDDAVLLELWGGGRLLRELAVPPAVHGAVYNDGWFATGADWSADESRVAYVAEV